VSYDDDGGTIDWVLNGVLGIRHAEDTNMASDTTHDLYIGVDPTDRDGWDWNGKIYDIYLYRRQLLRAELLWNYTSRATSTGGLTWSAQQGEAPAAKPYWYYAQVG